MVSTPKVSHVSCTRGRNAFRLKPAVLAVRTALALSLAIATAQPALAGTCDVSAPSSATCNGDFTDTTIAFGIDDLTLVVVGEAPTTIDPADGAHGIDLYANEGSLSLTSMAAITATDASAISLQTSYGDLYVRNASDATIAVASIYGGATGIAATSVYGSIAIRDEGVIDLTSVSYGESVGIDAATMTGNIGISLTETAAISVDLDSVYGGSAIGVRANSTTGSASVTHCGQLSVDAAGGYGSASAHGIETRSGYYGYAQLVNSGAVSTSASVDSGYADAIGLYSSAQYGYASIVVNTETGVVGAAAAVAETGYAQAFGAASYATHLARLENSGALAAVASANGGTAVAAGAVTSGMFALTLNYGGIGAEATVHGDGSAQAFASYTAGEVATLYNEGGLSASAQAGAGQATAYGAQLYGAWLAAHNDGEVAATASADAGMAIAYGVNAFAFSGSTVTNAGAIDASAHSVASEARATGVHNFAYEYGAYVENSGAIAVHADSGSGIATATGIYNVAALYGNSGVTNSGDVGASATVAGYGVAQATGAYLYSFFYGPQIVNSGTVAATARTASGGATATAIAASFYHGDAVLDNTGLIAASAAGDDGLFGSAEAYAVVVDHELGKYNLPSLTMVNRGDIEAEAAHGGEYGYAGASAIQVRTMYADAMNYRSIVADAVATGMYGDASAIGVSNLGKYDVEDVNHGSIVARAVAHLGGDASATGVSDSSVYTDVVTRNYGDLTASAVSVLDGEYGGSARVTGLYVHANYASHVYNEGAIVAYASAAGGHASVAGVAQAAKYDQGVLANAGDIIAIAYADGGYASVSGADLNSKYGATTINSGTIEARAVADAGSYADAVGSITLSPGAHGYFPYATGSMLYNHGIVRATAHADGGQASALGSRVEGASDADSYTYNGHTILAIATAEGGEAFATGSKTWGYYGDAVVTNAGDILALAQAGQAGSAFATGANAASAGIGQNSYHAGYARIANAGTIAASASASDYAWAIGVQGNGELGAILANDGVIEAAADAGGGIAQAAGISLSSSLGSLSVANEGAILATADGGDGSLAIGVHMSSNGLHTLINHGLIAAYGTDATRTAVWSSDGAAASIDNAGTIIGAIRTGDLADDFENRAGATWRAIGASTFGGGDDRFVNHGTLVMDNATIEFGEGTVATAAFALFASSAEHFDNAGTMVVWGSDNAIGLGDGIPLSNNGLITFVDGETDDVLTLAGSLAGEGTLALDVSGATLEADRLHIDGPVSGSQTIDVNLLDLPQSADVWVPLLTAQGALVDTFALGHVQYAPGFLTMDFSLRQTGDTLALGMEITGLNDIGTLAATIAPGVQHLVDVQVGGWRQRGGATDMGKAGLAPWLRAFTGSGEMNLRRDGDFGPTAPLGFRQHNHGWELGLDARPSERLALGAMIAKSEGRQTVPAAGSDRFDASTFGLYATWMADDGFYIDVSHRWMHVDARLQAASGVHRAEASAQVWNVEAGLTAWTSAAGVRVLPEMQYTRTRVGDIEALANGPSEFASADGVSSRVRLGLRFDKRYERGGFVFAPYGAVHAIREFDADYRHAIDGSLQAATHADGTSAMVEMGLGLQRAQLTLTGGFSRTDGGAQESASAAHLSLRYTW